MKNWRLWGRLNFTQFMPNKPNKYGVKIFCSGRCENVLYLKYGGIRQNSTSEGQFKVNNEPLVLSNDLVNQCAILEEILP
jgi:hypothetical protein